jgi:peptide chain release factor 1
MKDSIQSKLQKLTQRYEEIASLLADPKIIANQNKFRDLSKEYAQIEPIAMSFKQYQALQADIESAKAMLAEPDKELQQMAQEELEQHQQQLEQLEQQIQILLLPEDKEDKRNVYLEIRAGTGGSEAAIFAGDLFRMYSRYAELKKWHIEVISSQLGDHGGFKEIISKISGKEVYAQLKFESGAHRVQRVPETESQGRIHTSACTIAIMPEVEEIDEIEINPDDLRVDTFRASGAGGQHVNKTDSAIRITHLPSGIVVECQDERSQHKNRSKAMNLLKSKMLAEERKKQEQEQASTRKSLVGSGDRSERIRTYNFPQGRITDHRINLTLYKLDDILEGNLDQLTQPLVREYQAEQLANFDEQNQ